MTHPQNQSGQGSSGQKSSTPSNTSRTSRASQVVGAATMNGMKKIKKRKRGKAPRTTSGSTSGMTSSMSGSMPGMTSPTPIQPMTPPPLLPPAPVLRATAVTGADEEGRCGYFVRERNWSVDNPVAGFIIQRVTRTFNVEKLEQGSWQAINGAALDSFM